MALTNTKHPKVTQDRPFEHAAMEILHDLRSSVGKVIGHLPHAGQIRRPADLQRQLQLDSKLAWQIHRLAFTTDGLPGGSSMPKIPAMKRFLNAASGCGVSEDIITSAHRVLDQLGELIAVHAGDFTTFESMVSGLAEGGLDQVDFSHRRAAFRAQSHLWGVQVRTQLWCSLYHPGKVSQVMDSASIRGLRDIRRLRAGAPLRLAGHRLTDSRNQVTELHSLDSASPHSPSDTRAPSLLLDFCTQPCPELEHRVDEGYVDTYLRETPLGNAGVQTLYLADVTRGIKWDSSDLAPSYLNNNVANSKPAEAIVLDTLVYRGMFGKVEPEIKVFGSLDKLGETDPAKFRHEEVLPIQAEVRSYGTGQASLPTPHVPRYAEMIETVCDRLGWELNEFELFRCIIEYPVLGSVVNIRFPLP